MTNHVAIAALIVDGAGALLLTKAIAFQTAAQYGREQPAALYTRSTSIGRDRGRAWDIAEAQAGALLLLIGFLGQAVGAAHSDWCTAGAVIAYGLAAVLILSAWLSRPWLARRFERELFVERIDQEFQRWQDAPGQKSRRKAIAEYRSYLAHFDRNEDFDKWAEAAKRRSGIDPRDWEEPPTPDAD